MKTSIFERIQQFNQGLDPDRLQLKYQKMQADSFCFFRGTCHLFYEDWSAHSSLNQAPLTWICGDLHLENFGSFKGDDRLVYFDINDFDEAVLAPCTWELARLLTSLFVASQTLKLDLADAVALGESLMRAYTVTLATGKARSIQTQTATGMVKDLLSGLQQRKRRDLLQCHTDLKKDKRQITIDSEHTIAIPKAERLAVKAAINAWALTQDHPKFFKVLDVAGRIVGTGSLGVKRYLLLVKGKSSPDENYLLDLKQIRASSLQRHLKAPQPDWADSATRVVEIQTRVQATPPALLHPIALSQRSFVLRELQPSEDKLSLDQWNGKLRRLDKALQTMGELTASGQLRSTGRQGSAIADDLIAFAQTADWHDTLMTYAQTYARQVESDYQAFCAASGKL